MLPVPSNDTPPIFLALANAVAVAALPLQDPDEPDVLPVTLPVKAPINVVAVTIPTTDAFNSNNVTWEVEDQIVYVTNEIVKCDNCV